MGRPHRDLLDIYTAEARSHPVFEKVGNGVYVSHSRLSLKDYIVCSKFYYSTHHQSQCKSCPKMLAVAELVMAEGYLYLSRAFHIVSPGTKYTAERARRRLLRMPLVSVCMGDPIKGMSSTLVLEHSLGVDYLKMSLVINRIATVSSKCPQVPERQLVKALIGFAQSDRERECIKYAIFKSSGMSATKIRRLYGIEKMNEHASWVDSAIAEKERIYEIVEDIANIQDKAALAALGIDTCSGVSSDDSDNEDVVAACGGILSPEIVELSKQTLISSNYNWFCLIKVLEDRPQIDTFAFAQEFFLQIPNMGFDADQMNLIIQSKEAYEALKVDSSPNTRREQASEGYIVTDSENESLDMELLGDPLSEEGRLLIAKRRKAIQQQKRRLRAKAIAEKRLLSRKRSKRVSKILTDCPNIGKDIEEFVSNNNVGADAWRRTGVLTFDGNTKLPQKVTYERIRQHLEKMYGRHFSYGSIVQLCVARNKRHLSAKRYRCIAKVTTRRARKGFTLRYNPDTHWSASFYQGLNLLQLKDCRDICLVNRDDATGFRLDTLTTCKQYGIPTLEGQQVLTTRTDYVNKYPSTLQTTSYNFTSSLTTEEICVGVVKAPSNIHPKNPCQHYADLNMLESKEELKAAFYNHETGSPKAIDCVRVDGAADEGPSHHEVQFYWCQRHILKNKFATLVTTRCSGASYLNRVELQNGCLSRGHAATFIPSTLAGSCINPNTGSIDQDKLCENMNLAIEAYISRVDKAPCGDTVINLYRGAESTEEQDIRKKLLIFLKGSNTKKRDLASQDPTLYANFQLVWRVRKNHMVCGLPSYVFFLLCCFQSDCPHPRCKLGVPTMPLLWYPDGPPLSHLPFPVPDPERPWGSSCPTCKSFCSGHYKTVYVDIHDNHALSKLPMPPSVVLKELFSANNGKIEERMLNDIAKRVLLPPEECKIWLQHLQSVVENRRRGARKAAESRRARLQEASGTNNRKNNIYQVQLCLARLFY